MNSLQHTTISETQAVHTIMTACRANQARDPRLVGAWSVTFTKLMNGMHRANVRANGSSEVAATAIVDEFDN